MKYVILMRNWMHVRYLRLMRYLMHISYLILEVFDAYEVVFAGNLKLVSNNTAVPLDVIG